MLKKVYLVIIALTLTFSAFAVEDQDFYVAHKAYSDGFYDAANKLFSKFITDYPKSSYLPEANVFIAKSIFYQGNYQQSMDMLSKMLDDPIYKDYRDEILYFLAQVDIKAKKYSQAREKLTQFMQLFPDSDIYWWGVYAMGFSYFQDGNKTKSLEYFKKVIDSAEDKKLKEDAFYNMASIYYDLSDYTNLREIVDNWFEILPESSKLDYMYFYIAESNYFNKDFDTAIDYYLKALDYTQEASLKDMIYQGLGWSYLKDKNLDEAEKYFSKLLSQELKLYSLGNLYASKNDSEKALELFNDFLDKFPVSKLADKVNLSKAEILYNLGRINDALRIYNTILSNISNIKDPQVIETAYYGQGWCYLKQGKFKEAAEGFKNIANASDDKVVKISAQVQMAQVYQNQGNYSQAIKIYEDILVKWPNNLYGDYITLQIGISLLNMQDLDEAILTLRGFLKDFPSSGMLAEANYYLILAYYASEDWDLVSQNCELFIKQFSSSYLLKDVFLIYVDALAFKGEDKEFMKLCSRIESIFKNDKDFLEKFLIKKALAFIDLGDNDSALDILNRFLKDHPKSDALGEVTFYLAGIYYDKGDYQKAGEYYKDIIGKFTDSFYANQARYNLAQIYLDTNALDEANRLLLELSASADRNVSFKAKMMRIDIMLDSNNYQGALFLLDDMLKKKDEPRNFILFKMAQIYDLMNQYAKAIEYYRMAIKEGFANSEAKYLLARDLERVSNFEGAIKIYFDIVYLESDQYSLSSLIRLGDIYQSQKDYPQAIKIYEKIQDLDIEESKFAVEKIKELKEKINNK